MDQRGEATISNDGATILKLLDVVHPAARMLVDAARAQDAEVGDGTTSTTLLAAELLRQCKDFVEEGMNPHIIVRGYRKACQMVSCSLCCWLEERILLDGLADRFAPRPWTAFARLP